MRIQGKESAYSQRLGIEMGRFGTLFKETWLLWLVFAIAGGLMTAFVSRVFVVTFPICIFTFFWFAFIRYDAEGNFKGS